MTTTRAQFRTHIGKALGRRYYVSSTTVGTSTATQVVDTKRNEARSEWDGAEILVGSDRVTVRGSEPSSGRIYLDRALSGGAPATGTAYELLKGWTFNDIDEATDWAHANCYPALYLPVNDTATTETTGTSIYALTESWRSITQVRREVDGSANPIEYEVLFEGNDYFLRHGTAGLVYEANYTTKTGINLHFIGRGILTIDSSDASTSLAPWQVIVPGALHYLYDKGINADESVMTQRLDQEAQRQLQLFEEAKKTYRMMPQRLTARLPRVDITNDGSSARDTF